MFQLDRHKKIYDYILKNKNATVNELAEICGVATMTIRRDLDKMEKDSLITRVFGGAVIDSHMVEEVDYSDKEKEKIEEKIKIAQEAVKLVSDNSIIILDAGTTCMEIAKLLVDKKNLKVITTDIMIAAYLMKYQNIEVYCTGGRIQPNIGSCLDTYAMDFLNSINADICFVGASAISKDFELTTFVPVKSKIKQSIINASKHKVLVTDASKFGKTSFCKINNLKEFEIVIVNKEIEEELVSDMKQNGINIKLV